MNYSMMDPALIREAHDRICKYINKTPLLESSLLNELLGHQIIFKAEGFQKIGAFKIRGALNAIISLKESGNLPKEIVTFSSGNHAQAVALAGKMFGIRTTVFMTQNASSIKKQATIGYNANVINTQTRKEAEERTAEMTKNGAYFLHPFDDDMIIAGQGTSAFEALSDGINPNAIFATCGGGGWLSGTYLASKLFSKNILIYAGEPLNANDATQSYNNGIITKFDDSPKTIADGATSLCVSDRTFCYLKKLDGFYEISEEEIIYWTQWLTHLLKISVEPTSAVAMAASFKWMSSQKQKQKVLVMLSGANISPEIYHKIWEKNYLEKLPNSLESYIK